jgi:acetyl esterase/lipase
MKKLVRQGRVPFPPVDMKADIRILRNALIHIRAIQRDIMTKPSARPYTTQDVQVPLRDGQSIPARIYQPRGMAETGCPCLFVCAGGGFITGDIESEEELCGLFAALGGIAVNAIYRRAPEFQFPVPVLDSYDALKWVSKLFISLYKVGESEI